MRAWLVIGLFGLVGGMPASAVARTPAEQALLDSLRQQYGRAPGLSLPKRKIVTPRVITGATPPGRAGVNVNGDTLAPPFDPFKILESLWWPGSENFLSAGGAESRNGNGKGPTPIGKDESGKKDDGKPDAPMSNPGAQLSVNESAPDGGKSPGERPPEAPRDTLREPPPGGGGSSAVALPKWLPTCILIDPSIPNGNDIVRGLAKIAADCGVVLDPYPFTIRSNYPNSPDAINNNAKKACDLDRVLGVPFASVSTIVKYRDTAGIMCGETEDPESVAGCAELGKGPGGGGGRDRNKMQQQMQASGHFGGNVSGGIAANIVVPQGANAEVTAHENFGHNWMGEPNGPAYGLGIGENGGGGGGGSGGFNAAGCAILAASAFPNDGTKFYDPSRAIYYVKTDEERFQYDLMAGRSFFEGPPGLPPIPPPPPNRPPGGQPPAAPPPPKSPPKLIAVSPPGSKHQKPPGGAPPPAKKPGSSGGGIGGDFGFELAGDPGRGEGASSLGVDESAKDPKDEKALSEDFFAGNKPSGGDSDSSSLGVDENATDPNKKGDAADRLLASVKEADAGASGSDGAGGKDGKQDGSDLSLDGDPGSFFEAGAAGEPGILEAIVDATSDLLDAEFFENLFKKKEEEKPAAARPIRVIKEIYK